MADKTELEIAIGPDGEVRIVTHGLKGQSCVVETQDLETVLGQVTKREKTKEFYMEEQRGRTKLRNP